MSATLKAWLFAAAMHFAPPEKLPQFDGHKESRDEVEERYASIASDIADAVGDRKDARHWAALALAWGIGESHLAHDADVGPCYRRGSYASRCDGGLAASIWQIHAHTSRETGERVTVAMLFADRGLAARIAVRGLISSWTACRHLEPRDRFSQFGIGRCLEGNASVRARFALYQRIKPWEPAE